MKRAAIDKSSEKESVMQRVPYGLGLNYDVVKTETGYKRPIGWDGFTLKPNMWADCMEDGSNVPKVAQNDQANPDAAKTVPTPETEDGGSGSAYCSPLSRWVAIKDTTMLHEADGTKTGPFEYILWIGDPSQIVAIVPNGVPVPRPSGFWYVMTDGSKLAAPASCKSCEDAYQLLISLTTSTTDPLTVNGSDLVEM